MGYRSINSVNFASDDEREFWNNSQYSVQYNSRTLLHSINSSGYPMQKLTTRGLYEYIYSVCGVQPGECLIKRVNGSHGYGEFTIEIRFVDAYTASLFKLGST